VIVEPYYDVKYRGAILQHPNFPHIFLIEYGWKADGRDEHKGFIYDEVSRKIQTPDTNEIDDLVLAQLAQFLAEHIAQERETCIAPGVFGGQMEFGFDSPYKIRDFQYRVSKKLDDLGEFRYSQEILFGRTPESGIEMVIVEPTLEPNAVEELTLISHRAREEGYKLCMIVPSRLEAKAAIAAIPDNIGLAITSKGALIQSHSYFNLLVSSDNFISLPCDAAIDALSLHPGEIVKYRSDGRAYSFEVKDQTKPIMQGVRDILNR